MNNLEKLAVQQFDDIACEYKIIFSTPVSRPRPIPTPLSFQAALNNQNNAAKSMKTIYDSAKRMAVERKRQQIELAKEEQRRIAAIKEAEEAKRRQQEEEALRLQEEEYRKELEKHNRSTMQKIFDFLTGK